MNYKKIIKYNIDVTQCYKSITYLLTIKLIGVKYIVHKGGMNMNELLGNRIRTIRNAKNFTQEQVAEKIGISRQKYARIESGNNNITLEVLAHISLVLDVTVADITRVLDEEPMVAYRVNDENSSSQKIFDMIDLFYANKRLYNRLQYKDMD